MEKRRVLLVTDSDIPEIWESCLDKNNYSLQVTRGLSEGLQALSKNEYSVIIADLRQAQDQVKLFSEAREVNFWIKAVSIAHFPLEDFLAKIASLGLCLNAVAGAQALNTEELSLTVDKLFGKDIFGIEKYCAKEARFSAMPVRESNKKQECIEHAVNFAKGFTQDKRVLASVQDILDELLMNAFFDAPCNEQGEYLYAQADRTRTISLTKDEAAGLHLACDGKKLIISVTDCFGSLERVKLIEHLAKCVSSPDAQVEIKLGGSGVGIYNILEQVTSFVINLRYRKKTEVICVLDISTSIREIQKRYKSFHIFTAEEKIDIGESLSVERQEYGDTLRLSFYGVINENAIFGRIFETGKIKLAVNLRGVKRINSCGVREWVNALRTIPQDKKLEFSECSLAMVKQFNMIANFWAHGRIVSFVTPYFCPRCNRQVEKLVVVEEHLEDLLNLKAPNFSCPVCQDVLQFDDLEDKYFQFILRQESTL